KGFAKTLPDGKLEWAINTKADGSVTVNGVMLKPADPAVDDSVDDGGGADDESGDDNGGGANGGSANEGSNSGGTDNGGAGAKLNP
ncbi:MAG: hypothetical protein E5W19_06000, partial [Mesorhizobium sp.]